MAVPEVVVWKPETIWWTDPILSLLEPVYQNTLDNDTDRLKGLGILSPQALDFWSKNNEKSRLSPITSIADLTACLEETRYYGLRDRFIGVAPEQFQRTVSYLCRNIPLEQLKNAYFRITERAGINKVIRRCAREGIFQIVTSDLPAPVVAHIAALKGMDRWIAPAPIIRTDEGKDVPFHYQHLENRHAKMTGKTQTMQLEYEVIATIKERGYSLSKTLVIANDAGLHENMQKAILRQKGNALSVFPKYYLKTRMQDMNVPFLDETCHDMSTLAAVILQPERASELLTSHHKDRATPKTL